MAKINIKLKITKKTFVQGDLEKQELKLEPIPMMDREKKDKLPSMQVNFIDEICLPVYEGLASASPHLKPLLQGTVGWSSSHF